MQFCVGSRRPLCLGRMRAGLVCCCTLDRFLVFRFCYEDKLASRTWMQDGRSSRSRLYFAYGIHDDHYKYSDVPFPFPFPFPFFLPLPLRFCHHVSGRRLRGEQRQRPRPSWYHCHLLERCRRHRCVSERKPVAKQSQSGTSKLALMKSRPFMMDMQVWKGCWILSRNQGYSDSFETIRRWFPCLSFAGVYWSLIIYGDLRCSLYACGLLVMIHEFGKNVKNSHASK